LEAVAVTEERNPARKVRLWKTRSVYFKNESSDGPYWH